MRHTHAIRFNTLTGLATHVSFNTYHGSFFTDRGSSNRFRDGGYSTEDALIIVNRWNYLAYLVVARRSVQADFYYLPSAEGAGEPAVSA